MFVGFAMAGPDIESLRPVVKHADELDFHGETVSAIGEALIVVLHAAACSKARGIARDFLAGKGHNRKSLSGWIDTLARGRPRCSRGT